jgi:hypothetical protein
MPLRTELARRLAHVLPPTERPLGSSVVRDRNLCSGSIRFRLHVLHVLLTLCNRRKLCVYPLPRDSLQSPQCATVCPSTETCLLCGVPHSSSRVYGLSVALTSRARPTASPAPPGHVAARPRALPRMLVACFALLFTPYCTIKPSSRRDFS